MSALDDWLDSAKIRHKREGTPAPGWLRALLFVGGTVLFGVLFVIIWRYTNEAPNDDER